MAPQSVIIVCRLAATTSIEPPNVTSSIHCVFKKFPPSNSL